MCADREKHFTLNTYTESTIPRVYTLDWESQIKVHACEPNILFVIHIALYVP